MNRRMLKEKRKQLRKLNVPNVASVIDYALGKGLISVYEVLESRYSKRKLEAN
jgi:hypothetical protein